MNWLLINSYHFLLITLTLAKKIWLKSGAAVSAAAAPEVTIDTSVLKNMNRNFHDHLTLLTSTEKLGFELAPVRDHKSCSRCTSLAMV